MEEAEDLKCVFDVYCVLETLVRELLSNNSQWHEDKSLALHPRDLIFFSTYLQTVNYYTTIHCYGQNFFTS